MAKESPFEVVIQPWTKNSEDFDSILGAVLRIERECYRSPWSVEDFEAAFSSEGVAGVVAKRGDTVLGYAILCVRRTGIEIYNIAVRPKSRRIHVGSDLVNYIITRALSTKVKGVIVHLSIREHNLPAQLFFKSLGFLYTHTLPDFYEDTKEDAYVLALAIIPSPKTKKHRAS